MRCSRGLASLYFLAARQCLVHLRHVAATGVAIIFNVVFLLSFFLNQKLHVGIRRALLAFEFTDMLLGHGPLVQVGHICFRPVVLLVP